METLIRHAIQVCTALVGAAALIVAMAAAAEPAALSPVQSKRSINRALESELDD
jgi:hypothetical protein